MPVTIERRELIAALGGTVLAWPLVARAQQATKLPTIGFLGPSTLSDANAWVTAFAQRLRELGWIEGRTVAIEYRWADGRDERYAQIADEFARLKVDVIVTPGGAALTVKQATSGIPIVFTVTSDPLASGLVASLARPGGNATGLSLQTTDTVAKRIELLRELVPGLRRLAVFFNVGSPQPVLEMRQVQKVASAVGLEVTTLEIARVEEIVPAFQGLRSRADFLYVCGDPLAFANRVLINTLAAAAQLPTMYGFREHVDTGGLISYGPNFPDLWRRAADYVDKILRGAKPADIPVEQPTKFDLVINLTTAKALGLDVPPTLLARATDVID